MVIIISIQFHISFRILDSIDKSSSYIKSNIIVITVIVIIGIVITIMCQQYINKKQGISLINKIEQYKTNHGNYPDSLGELIPAYYKKLPIPHTGIWFKDSFFYARSEDSISFIVSFYCFDGSERYDSREGRWNIFD
jgi:predicted PurR-regulated permease PerM